MQISINFGTDFPSKADVTREVTDAKRLSLMQAQQLLKEQQAAGAFPTDPADYQLILTNRGQESRRNFDTIDPRYLRLPYSLTWVQTGGGTEIVREAALAALELLRRRAPTRSGAYLASTSIYVDRRAMALAAFKTFEITPATRVAIAPDTRYSSTIERGFYKDYYKQSDDAERLRGGIVRPIAKLIRDRFGRDVACRFSYQRIGRDGAGTQPVIEIAVAGAFVQNDAVPGMPARRSGPRLRNPRRR